MTPTLSDAELAPVVADLQTANQAFLARYPGESSRRQPVHVVYGGAHLFKADTARKLGEVALRSLREYAPDPAALAGALGVDWQPAFAEDLYARVVAKLEREPVEDFRLDFEDGYGNRPDEEEDAHAVASAGEVAAGMAAGTLPPFIGIRIKPFNEDLRARSMRTLDLFVSALVARTGGLLPENFVVTIPKVQIAAHVTAAARTCALLEPKLGLATGALRLELMVETPQAIIDAAGVCPLLGFIEAAQGRCASLHFGVYDYTASFGITASYQAMGHPACDFARTVMVAALAGTGVQLSDGATNILPVAVHPGREPVRRAGAGEPRGGPRRVAAGVRGYAAFAAERHLRGLGFAPRPTRGALCGGVLLLPGGAAAGFRAVAGLREKGGARLAVRRRVRRRGDRPGAAEFFSARHLPAGPSRKRRRWRPA